MIYAIDHDGTWTRDPALLAHLVAVATRCGTTCVMLTGRSDEPPWGDEVRQAVKGLDMPIIFAAGAGKRDALDAWLTEQGRAVEHTVVIDDNPEYFAPQNPRLIVGRRLFNPPEGHYLCAECVHISERALWRRRGLCEDCGAPMQRTKRGERCSAACALPTPVALAEGQ